MKYVHNGFGESKFPLLGKLMTNLLALPHSTAFVELQYAAYGNLPIVWLKMYGSEQDATQKILMFDGWCTIER